MENLYKIEYSKENLEKLFKHRLNKKDFEGALCVLFTMRKFYGEAPSLYEKFAHVYYQIEEYSKAINYWFLYLFSCGKASEPKAYNGLGACFYKLDNSDLASYYFNQQLKFKNTENYPYNDVALELYDEVYDVKSRYYIAYPYDKANFDEFLVVVSLLVKSGCYSEAIKKLDIIPENSKYYVDALIQKSLCYFLMNKEEMAIKLILQAVELDNENVVALFNAVSMLFSNGRLVEADAILKILESSKAYNNEENFEKIAMIYCEVNNYVKAEIFLAKALIKNPLRFMLLKLMGITKCNLNKYCEALAVFEKLNRVNPSYVNRYYVALTKRLVKKSERGEKIKRLDYTFDLQLNEFKKLDLRFKELSSLDEFDKRQTKKALELIDYAFSSGNLTYQNKSLRLLNRLDEATAIKAIEKLLIKLDVYDSVRRSLIAIYVQKGFEGTMNAIFASMYSSAVIYQPYFSKCKVKALKDAYSICVSKLVQTVNDFTSLYKATNDIIDVLEESDNEVFDDVFSLSATIYDLAGLNVFSSRRQFLRVFNANQRTVKRYKELILLKGMSSSDELEKLLDEIAMNLDKKLGDEGE